MKLFRILLFAIFFCSCANHFITEESLIKDNSWTDYSTHYYIYPKTLPGLLSTEYYKITAYLSQEDSHLVLFSHFNSFELEDGIKIKFERNKAVLTVKASVKNSNWKSLLQIKDYFLKNQEIDFTIEVKNGTEEGAFIQIWENFITRNNTVKLKRQTVTTEALLANTEDIIFYRKGEGLKWGLKLFRSRLTQGARVSSPLL